VQVGNITVTPVPPTHICILTMYGCHQPSVQFALLRLSTTNTFHQALGLSVPVVHLQ
jgi:hypothetical protein